MLTGSEFERLELHRPSTFLVGVVQSRVISTLIRSEFDPPEVALTLTLSH